jgi:hypothetical protein
MAVAAVTEATTAVPVDGIEHDRGGEARYQTRR